ncbi:MAG: hypothetical protein V1804_00560 [Patescibacteria group bacterium]
MRPVEELSDNNFLNVYYIASEIKRELEIALTSKIYIPESHIYSQKNPNIPCFSNIRNKILYYLKNIGEIEEYHPVNRGRIGLTVVSQDKFFLFCSKLADMHNERLAKLNTLSKNKEQQELVPSKNNSTTLIENETGYFKFQKQGEKIKIGGKDTRHFRLLRLLCDPIDTARTIEVIFDSIKIPRDKNDSMLNSFNNIQSINRKLEIVRFAIKELQKIKRIQGKLKFIFDENQKTYRLRIS